jgi:flap endonuclease-1
MGLQISELVPKKEISFKDLQNKKIAVDASQMLYQFLSSIRQQDSTPLMDSKQRITSHLQGIITRITNLMAQDIKLCFVFDGKPPLLKIKTQEEREYRKQLAEEKFREAKEEQNEELMLRYSKQSIRLKREMIDESKELIRALGLPVIESPSESDIQMAFMNEREDVWACASSDFDCLLHGAPRLVRNLTVSQRKRISSGAYINVSPQVIELEEVLNNLGINQDQLIVLSILIGTDYNYGVPKVGPKTALRLVKQYKNFDNLFKEIKADFDWKKIYAVFKNMPVIKNYKLRWDKPNVEKIMKLLVDEHEFNQERVQKNIDRIINVKKIHEQGNLTKYF